MVEDPVCGMMIMPEDAVAETEYDGETYYFCCDNCLEEFESEPERYVRSTPEPVF